MKAKKGPQGDPNKKCEKSQVFFYCGGAGGFLLELGITATTAIYCCSYCYYCYYCYDCYYCHYCYCYYYYYYYYYDCYHYCKPKVTFAKPLGIA